MTIIIIFFVCALAFILWAGWPLIQNFALSIETWLRRKRLRLGEHPKRVIGEPWKPKKHKLGSRKLDTLPWLIIFLLLDVISLLIFSLYHFSR